MNITAQLKLVGDSYSGGFSNGITLCDSGTMDGFSLVSESSCGKVFSHENGLTLSVSYINKNNETEIITSVTNNGDKACTLEMLTSFMLKDLSVVRVHRMQTAWSAEGKLKSESIADLHIERSWNGCATRIEKFGTVGSMPVRQYFPFIALEDENGNFTAVQLYLASSWQMELFLRDEHTYTLCGGIADRNFGQWTKQLNSGETFTAPKAVLATGSSLLEVCDKLVKAQNPAISPLDDNMDILFNEYCTTWGNPSYDNVKKIADKIAGKGIKFLVIDSGWYGQSDGWWESVGDWTVNVERFPGGMKPIADYIRSKGMIPGLWFEMESVTSKASNFSNTKLLVSKDGYPLTVGNRRFYDMESPDALNYLSNTVIKILKDSGFGYLKVDYNDTMGIGCDGPDSPGENLRKKVLGSQAFFRKIAEEIPGIVIENCSSGGHRLEPSMMELCSEASFSDAHETTAIPIIAANLHRVIRPSQSQIWAVMRATDSDNRIYYSIINTFLGRMCLSGDIYNLSDHQWQLIDEGITFYKQISHIIKSGTTTVIANSVDSYANPVSEQLVLRELGAETLLLYHRFENSIPLSEALKKYSVNIDLSKVSLSYGSENSDFSAVAMLIKNS